jgi:single-strand DNA-binding protein
MTIETAILGTLGRDAESKISKNGRPYLRLSVRAGDSDTGQWVNVMTFDETAIAAADKFTKGTRCYIEGKLTLDQWTTQDGEKRTSLSVMSWHCKLAAIGRNKSQAAPAPAKAKPEYDDQIPF